MAWMLVAFALIVVILLIVMLVPTRLAYTESVVIAAPADEIYDHIRLQLRLMQWSAWPTETGASCTVEGPDGEVGTRLVFLTAKGARFGHQEVSALEPGRRVGLRLFGKGPPQQPELAFALEPAGPAETRVTLHFRNRIARPFNVALRLLGIVRWTRAMHHKDLAGLKRFAEPPRLTYAGAPAEAPSLP